MFKIFKNTKLVNEREALEGSNNFVSPPKRHHVNGEKIIPPWPENTQRVLLGLGCFWGAERIFWETEGVFVTSVGYSGGFTTNPSYEEVCSGNTGHAEVVEIIFKQEKISFKEILCIFFESHNPTQGMRQGNDRGSQYRSIIFFDSEIQRKIADSILKYYNEQLTSRGFKDITTELKPTTDYYLAENYHQQYLSKVPNGYCGLKGTGVECNNV